MWKPAHLPTCGESAESLHEGVLTMGGEVCVCVCMLTAEHPQEEVLTPANPVSSFSLGQADSKETVEHYAALLRSH